MEVYIIQKEKLERDLLGRFDREFVDTDIIFTDEEKAKDYCKHKIDKHKYRTVTTR